MSDFKNSEFLHTLLAIHEDAKTLIDVIGSYRKMTMRVQIGTPISGMCDARNLVPEDAAKRIHDEIAFELITRLKQHRDMLQSNGFDLNLPEWLEIEKCLGKEGVRVGTDILEDVTF